MSSWIDFKKLRAKLNFRPVLESYGIAVASTGTQHIGPCPLPTHPKGKTGNTFSANLERGIWQCFGCKAKGNIIEFAAYMEKFDPQKADEFRKIAVLLNERFCSPKPSVAEKPKPVVQPLPVPLGKTLVNAPLDFELKRLDAEHPTLQELQLKPETIAEFGLGFCSHGYFKDRIAIPLKNRDGHLVGYAGLSNDSYLFPKQREREGTTYDFDPSLLLYGAERIEQPVETLYLVERCQDVWWLWQNGFQHTVAVMDKTVSRAQTEVLKSLVLPSGRIFVVMAQEESARLLMPYRFVRWVKPVKSLTYQKPAELKVLLRY